VHGYVEIIELVRHPKRIPPSCSLQGLDFRCSLRK